MNILDNEYIWTIFRKFIDIFFGIYRKRMEVIRRAGITNKMSIIDIAGGGQYSTLTKGKYLGIDLNPKYINYAKKVYRENGNRKFLCADANTTAIANSSYEVALLIDATHHLSDEENRTLFKTLNRVASKFIIICDPIKQSTNNLIGRFFTALDRGHHIRPKNKLLDLIEENFIIQEIINLKMMGIQSICIIARPKK